MILAGISALLALALSSPARGSGFLIYDMSGEAVGKASAYSASVDEPSAVWFNPAAMSFMPGYRAIAGGIIIAASNKFEPANGGSKVEADPGFFFLPTVFATAEILEWFHFGIGAYTAWGLGIEWPEDWIGREFTIKAAIETFTINPAVSFMVWKNRLSIAAGFSVIKGTVDMTNGLPSVVGGTVRIGGGTWGFGGNGAVMWRIIPEVLHAAVAYRSRVRLSFDGKADFDPLHEEFGYELRDQGGKADIVLPDIFTVGLMYRPMKNLTLGLDTNVILWSTYKELKLDFDSMPDTVMKRNFHDSVVVRIGAEYLLPVKGLKVRGGLIYDQNPSPKDTLAPSLPDAHRIDVSVGMGYSYKWFKADLGYMLVCFLPSKSTTGREGPEGEYTSFAHLIGITVGVQFRTEKKRKRVEAEEPSHDFRLAPPPPDVRPAPPRKTEPMPARPRTEPRPSPAPGPRPATDPRATPPRPDARPDTSPASRPDATTEGKPARPDEGTDTDKSARPKAPETRP